MKQKYILYFKAIGSLKFRDNVQYQQWSIHKWTPQKSPNTNILQKVYLVSIIWGGYKFQVHLIKLKWDVTHAYKKKNI